MTEDTWGSLDRAKQLPERASTKRRVDPDRSVVEDSLERSHERQPKPAPAAEPPEPSPEPPSEPSPEPPSEAAAAAPAEA